MNANTELTEAGALDAGKAGSNELKAEKLETQSIKARPHPEPLSSSQPLSHLMGESGKVGEGKTQGEGAPWPDETYVREAIHPPDPEPWPEAVDGNVLLEELARTLARFVVLPNCAQEALALWVLHTYAFQLRDVTAYVAIESPEKRCGKTTLLSLLEQLVHRPVASSNISPSAFFRVIKDLAPTLLIDEADTFLKKNDQLKGILNSGYSRQTAYVLRAASLRNSDLAPRRRAGEEEQWSQRSPSPQPSALRRGRPLVSQDCQCAVEKFSCWCPKVMAAIGRLPDTLVDRCIVIRMQRKTADEQRERSRLLDPVPLVRKCARFVVDHAAEIARARPELPVELHDRAADIWEPLLALADIAGGDWPEIARRAAVTLAAAAQENSPVGSLLMDILVLFTYCETDRLFTRDLVKGLNGCPTSRPWMELLKGRAVTEIWLAQQLRPYGIRPRTMWSGELQAKGYAKADFREAFRRYIPRSEIEALREGAGVSGNKGGGNPNDETNSSGGREGTQGTEGTDGK